MKTDKPWGFIKQYCLNKNCSVKMVVLQPNEETSLHWHDLRSDTWIVLDEEIKVQIGNQVHTATPGEEFFIPAGQLHRIMSGERGGRVLEIAFGYSDEEDNHRIADDYGRELDV